MEPQLQAPKSQRHKCAACYKQYKKKEHLIEHMRISYHSPHQPKCGVCKKYCRSLESVREHLKGPLPKGNCAEIFVALGCDLCLDIFDSADALRVHQNSCRLPPASPGTWGVPFEMCTQSEMGICSSTMIDEDKDFRCVALDCEMVGGGSDGSLDICARVCVIGENENVIFHTYVKPFIPVTNYRYETTGITEQHLIDAMPLMEVKQKVVEILYDGEELWRARLEGGKARFLVGHNADHDLASLKICYPDKLIRDTAIYPPLMKTNLVSHSLKYLTQTYLGYEIQSGVHDPFEDCVAALRLYKRMRAQRHQSEGDLMSFFRNDVLGSKKANNYDYSKMKELNQMSPEALLEMSLPKYRCWCLDK